jgi:hypothetical protein
LQDNWLSQSAAQEEDQFVPEVPGYVAGSRANAPRDGKVPEFSSKDRKPQTSNVNSADVQQRTNSQSSSTSQPVVNQPNNGQQTVSLNLQNQTSGSPNSAAQRNSNSSNPPGQVQLTFYFELFQIFS